MEIFYQVGMPTDILLIVLSKQGAVVEDPHLVVVEDAGPIIQCNLVLGLQPETEALAHLLPPQFLLHLWCPAKWPHPNTN